MVANGCRYHEPDSSGCNYLVSTNLGCYCHDVATTSKRTTIPTQRATDRPGDASPFAIGLLLRRAHDRAATALLDALRPLGLELRHFAVLIALNAHGTMTQRELVDELGSEKSNMVRVVDDLERAGLVERRPVPADRRAHAIAMTAKGTDVFDAAHEPAHDIAAELFAHLDPGDAAQLMDLLTRFTYPTTT
jgi:DNA-binding MarR family transcriptional regulator